jgi:hypothetical protein
MDGSVVKRIEGIAWLITATKFYPIPKVISNFFAPIVTGSKELKTKNILDYAANAG